MGSHVLKVTDDSFEKEVVQSELPILLDFWAEWCGPCKLIAPVLEEVAPGYSGKLKIGKLNVDENQNAPVKFGVMNIPTMIFFQGGKEKERIVGAMSKDELKSKLDRLLAG